MYCTECGYKLSDKDVFCAMCGKRRYQKVKYVIAPIKVAQPKREAPPQQYTGLSSLSDEWERLEDIQKQGQERFEVWKKNLEDYNRRHSSDKE